MRLNPFQDLARLIQGGYPLQFWVDWELHEICVEPPRSHHSLALRSNIDSATVTQFKPNSGDVTRHHAEHQSLVAIDST